MKTEPPNSTPSKVWTFVIVTSGSVLLCSKGVFTKLAYGHGLAAISVLNLRMLMAGDAIRRVGALLFGAIAVGFSCVFMCIHYSMVYSMMDMLNYPLIAYGRGLTLAVFGTVLPAASQSPERANC
ncbi:MAG: hypothetical protein JJU20_04475 [Opitutales bacterium]|nr:hypothetical protein [Opitutales bacterium]